MRSRLGALRTVGLLALGFVALRVLYRVVFGGGSGDGVLLLSLPRIPLEGPFAHIVLFGPVTSGGIATAASAAFPFAILILVVGLLGVVVDLRALLTRGSARGPLRAISRSLIVAWSTFPALRVSIARVRVARELRGERSLASLVVPILEQTVERAIALGGSMELRGFAATRRPDPDCERPVVIEDVDLGFEGGWILEGIDLRVEPATLTLISGPTGSGKSTLLHAISGLFQHQFGGEQAGRITVGGSDRMSTPPRETAGFVGVVSQSVRLSFVAATVREEVGFALAVRGVDPTIVAARVTETAAHLGIERLLHRDLVTLSAGEACLVAIAAALVERPLVLLVDEPLAELDTSARQRVVGLLGRLAHEAGVCVIVAEHALAEWDAVVDVRLELRDAHLRPGRAAGARSEPIASGHGLLSGATVAEIGPLSVSYDEQRVVDEVQLSLAAQEIVALSGSNGAGKSSLLHAIARPNQRDTVRVGGRDVHRMHRRARRRAVTLVPEQFDDLIFATTVAAECRRADRAAALAGAGRGTAATFFGLIGVSSDRAQRMLQRHPRDLSAGERLCLVIAIQLSTRPSLLLVDEPTRGLDAAARELLGAALTRSAATGTAVLFATHDAGFAARFADRTIDMIEGRVAAAVGVQP